MRRKAIMLTFVFLVLALSNISCSDQGGGKKIRLVTKETSLGKIPPRKDLIISPDTRRLAYVEQHPDDASKRVVVVDGVSGREYDEVDDLMFSPDGKHFAYRARRGSERQAKWSVVADGTEGKEYESVGNLLFSPNGKRLAYVAGDRGVRWSVVIDGAEGKKYDGVSELLFSPDSKHVAYIAKHGRSEFVVLDGTEGREHDIEVCYLFLVANFEHGAFRIWQKGRLLFSPDGGKLAYVAHDSKGDFVVLNGIEGKRYDDIDGLLFSPDGKRLAYTAMLSTRVRNRRAKYEYFVVVDGVEGEVYDDVEHGLLATLFSPDGNRLAYVAKRDGMELVVLDAVDHREYQSIKKGFLLFSPDSKRLAYVVCGSEGDFVVVDGEEGEAYNSIDYEDMFFSPDGKRLVYSSEDGYVSVVDGGKRGHSFTNTPIFSPDGKRLAYVTGGSVVVDGVKGQDYEHISLPVFSPDGRRVAYAAQRYIASRYASGDRSFVVVDGVEGEGYDFDIEDVLFSPDSKHVVCIAKRRGKTFIMVDGVESQEYDDLLGNRRDRFIIKSEEAILSFSPYDVYDELVSSKQLVFDSEKSLHFLASRDGEIMRVEIKIIH